MRAKSAVLLLLALGCGLVAAIGVTQVISKDTGSTPQTADTSPIIVALRDIAPGELITPQLVRAEPWPKEKVPGGALGKVEDVQGCRARTEILEGEPIREQKLLGKGVTQQTPTDYIPKGYRVVGVKVDLVSGAGLIRPGDRVDVLVNLKRNSSNDVLENRTQTILQDIKVFAVDDVFKVNSAGSEEDSTVAKTISLVVTPQQAEMLMMAGELGKVQLVMRSPGDAEVAQTKGITPSELLGKKEAGDRGKETPSPDPDASKSDKGIFDLLSQMRSKKPEPPAPQPAPQAATWSIRVIDGPAVNDVMLEETDPAGGVTGWRVGAPPAATVATPVAPVVAPAGLVDPQPKEEQDKPAQEGAKPDAN
jgi:pilus assembly protein CpaB